MISLTAHQEASNFNTESSYAILIKGASDEALFPTHFFGPLLFYSLFKLSWPRFARGGGGGGELWLEGANAPPP